MTTKAKGSCLCGDVKLTVELDDLVFDVCHCSMCRKWGGGPSFSVDANRALEIQGGVRVFASSEWAERGFCQRCGTHLFYQLKNGSYRNVTLGVLDRAPEFRFHSQVYIDDKPDCYDFANRTETLTEAQVIAKYAPKTT